MTMMLVTHRCAANLNGRTKPGRYKQSGTYYMYSVAAPEYTIFRSTTKLPRRVGEVMRVVISRGWISISHDRNYKSLNSKSKPHGKPHRH